MSQTWTAYFSSHVISSQLSSFNVSSQIVMAGSQGLCVFNEWKLRRPCEHRTQNCGCYDDLFRVLENLCTKGHPYFADYRFYQPPSATSKISSEGIIWPWWFNLWVKLGVGLLLAEGRQCIRSFMKGNLLNNRGANGLQFMLLTNTNVIFNLWEGCMLTKDDGFSFFFFHVFLFGMPTIYACTILKRTRE